jgi:hypothetical protein
MPLTQFRCSDLLPGDLLLKFSDGSRTGRLIQTGERWFDLAENSDVVHAGVMYDSHFVIEAQGPGVSANDLRVTNEHYGYIVFRCTHPRIAKGAAEFAKILFESHQHNQQQPYSIWGAFTSIFSYSLTQPSREDLEARVERIFAQSAHTCFCSQFVAFVYQFSAEQNGVSAKDVIPLHDTLIAPSKLAGMLIDNPAMFTEVGYLMPHER